MSMPLQSSGGLQEVVPTCPLNINVKRGKMAAIGNDIPRKCNMSFLRLKNFLC